MKKRLSISDIANSLGVSVTTVSFILNGKAKEKRISDAMIRRVLDYVKKVGYKPNQLAKSLRTGKSKTIGLLVEDISNAFFSSIADQIEKLAYDYGYHILYCSMNNDDSRAKELIQLFCDRQVDGFIIAPTEGLKDVIQRLLKDNVPVVLFDRRIEDLETHYVVSENLEGAFQGTYSLFKDRGASKVGFVTINSNQQQMKGRLDGYMKAVDEVGKDFSIKKINRAQDESQTIEEIKDFILDNKLDGVLFATNYLTLSGLKAIKKYALKLDNIVSFDENTAFSLVEPPISAIAQNIEEMANQVITILINEINGKAKGLQQVVVPCEFIKR